MTQNLKNFIPILILVLLFILMPMVSFAQGGLVPCEGPECGFGDLITLVNKVIDFLLFTLALPLAAILFAYGGFLFLTSGGSEDKLSKAKQIFWNVLVGFVIALAAWIIVKAIFFGLGFKLDISFIKQLSK